MTLIGWIKSVTCELGDKEAAHAVEICIVCVVLLFCLCRINVEKWVLFYFMSCMWM